MPETESSKQWYADESVWWNRHGEYMAFQWRLTPALNRVVRGALEREFSDYLFKECGTLLDLGCGSGWLAIHFAKRGMKVGGFDFSRELIDEAAASKAAEGLTDVHFECCDVVRRDFSDYEGKVDSVLINAFLHHLPEEDILAVFRNVGKVLKPGGRVYLYEPLKCEPKHLSPLPRAVDFFLNKLKNLIIGKVPLWLGLWDKTYLARLEDGYSSSSPRERPVDLGLLTRALPRGLGIVSIRGWHVFSLSYAMQAMSVRPAVRPVFFGLVPVWYAIDRLLMDTFGWDCLFPDERFTLCGVKLESGRERT